MELSRPLVINASDNRDIQLLRSEISKQRSIVGISEPPLHGKDSIKYRLPDLMPEAFEPRRRIEEISASLQTRLRCVFSENGWKRNNHYPKRTNLTSRSNHSSRAERGEFPGNGENESKRLSPPKPRTAVGILLANIERNSCDRPSRKISILQNPEVPILPPMSYEQDNNLNNFHFPTMDPTKISKKQTISNDVNAYFEAQDAGLNAFDQRMYIDSRDNNPNRINGLISSLNNNSTSDFCSACLIELNGNKGVYNIDKLCVKCIADLDEPDDNDNGQNNSFGTVAMSESWISDVSQDS